MEKALPTLMIVLQFFSAFPYFFSGDWRKGLYWLFAAGLTAVVTY